MFEEQLRLREQLIRLEKTNPEYRRKYEKEVSEMLSQELKGMRKWSLVGTGLLSIGLGVAFTTAAVVGGELPPLIRIGFAIGAAFSFAWVGMAVWILKGGVHKSRQHPTWMANWAWGVTLSMMIIFLMQAGKNPDSVKSVFMVLSGLVYLLMGALFLIRNCIEQAELKTREKLLEIELKLEEIAERTGVQH
jgi:hypothetical protein